MGHMVCCEECKYSELNPRVPGEEKTGPFLLCAWAQIKFPVFPDDFCGWGEIKEVEDEKRTAQTAD